MKQALLTNVIMGILVVLNLSLLAFVFTQKKPDKGPRGDRMRGKEPLPELVSRVLEFTPEQKEAYRKLGRKHHQGLMDLERDLGTSMLNFFLIESKNVAPEEANELLEKILEMEKAKVLYTRQHFEDIKNLCSEEQFEKFPEVLEVIFNKLNRGNNRAGRPRRPGGPNGPPPPKQRPSP